MKTGLLRQKKSRRPAAHAALAVLALAGAIGLQWLWKSPLPLGIESWQPYVVAVLISTTAWLLFTAWLHATLARRDSTGHRALLQAISDLAICGVAAYILAHGHNSTFALSNVWPICPVLIALAAPSAILLLSTLANSRNLAHAPTPSPTSIATFRLVSLAVLLVALLLLANR
jgi:hypothetical protein